MQSITPSGHSWLCQAQLWQKHSLLPQLMSKRYVSSSKSTSTYMYKLIMRYLKSSLARYVPVP